MSFIENFAGNILQDLTSRLRDAKDAHCTGNVENFTASQTGICILQQAINIVAQHAIQEIGTGFLSPLGLKVVSGDVKPSQHLIEIPAVAMTADATAQTIAPNQTMGA